MEDTEFSKGETILIGIICTVIFVVISGLIFAPDLFWDDFVKI
jgi:H+/gluconate symporter-like permease